MRAREIWESVSKPTLAVTVDAGSWYEASAAQVNNWYKDMLLGEAPLHVNSTARYFVFVPEGQKLWGLYNKVVILSDSHLRSIGPGIFYSPQEGSALQALVDVTQAKHGERVWGDFILYDGKVYTKSEFIPSLPVVAQISTGPVYEVPANARWALGKTGLKYKVSADRVVVFRKSSQGVNYPPATASIKSGKIMHIHSPYPLDPVTQVKFHNELTQALGLQIKPSVKTHIIPESKLHDVLRAVGDNPGVDRLTLYWRILKLVKLPTYKGKEDSVSELVQLGLVKETQSTSTMNAQDTDKSYTLTIAGKLMLARVNAGHAVPKSSLIK